MNSGIRRIGVATQYKAHSLIRHLQRGWNFFRPERNESFDILPASQRISETAWYAGTADAVYQNIDIIASYAPQHIVLLAGDHVYKMDYEPMLQQHVQSGADVTIGCLEVPRHGCHRLRRDACRCGGPADRRSWRSQPIRPACPTSRIWRSPPWGSTCSRPASCSTNCAAMRPIQHSARDFGRDIIPYIVKHGTAVAHRFARSCVRSTAESETYWRDVGTDRRLLGSQYRPHRRGAGARPL